MIQYRIFHPLQTLKEVNDAIIFMEKIIIDLI